MKAPAGIRNLLVTITSDSNEFIGLISQMGLGETFDLANPGDLEDKLGGSLEDGSGIGLIDPNDPIKDKSLMYPALCLCCHRLAFSNIILLLN